MGISIGVLALICALILLFGVQGTRKILGWGLGLLLLSAAGIGAFTWAWPKLQPATATPLEIMSALPSGYELNITPDLADKIRVTGPDKRIFIFAAGTEEAAIKSYMQAQFGAPGSPRAECWTKEPGPWCNYR